MWSFHGALKWEHVKKNWTFWAGPYLWTLIRFCLAVKQLTWSFTGYPCWVRTNLTILPSYRVLKTWFQNSVAHQKTTTKKPTQKRSLVVSMWQGYLRKLVLSDYLDTGCVCSWYETHPIISTTPPPPPPSEGITIPRYT